MLFRRWFLLLLVVVAVLLGCPPAGFTAREEALLQGWEGVGRLGRRDDGVPDDGFRVTGVITGTSGWWVGGEHVDEELFRVPVEQRG